MREILFRGKSVDSDKWVEGSFVHNLIKVSYSNYLCGGFIKPFGKTKEERLMVEVERKTVGQYTGLTDKNGKKIFEGDIVNVPFFTPPNMCIAFIEGAFCLANKDGEYVADIHYIHHAGIECTEVIGNIFDNPELLTED